MLKARRFLHGGIFLSLLLCSTAHGAPQVVTGLTLLAGTGIPEPPPQLTWAAIVDPATLSKRPDLPATLFGGGAVAADIYGHRAFLAAGGGIEVIDTIANGVEAVIGQGQYFSIRALAADPVRARLYASMDFPQPQILVVDTNTLSVLPPIALPKTLPAGQGISRPVVTPDGKLLYVLVANTLLQISLLDGGVQKSVVLDGFTPFALAVNTDRNELYVGDFVNQGVFVLAADSLAVKNNLPGFGSILSIAIRPSDSALLVEIDTGHGFWNTHLEAVNVATGAVMQTADGGGGAVVSIDGKQVYRLARGDLTPGGPFADTSGVLLVLDAQSLDLGKVALDSRAPNDPSRQNFAVVGTAAAAAPKVTLAIEYFNAALGHYFLTSFPDEIAGLDAGAYGGVWKRTGQALPVYAEHGDGPLGSVPVCRFYGRPEAGLDSHFYTASALECVQVQQAFAGSWLLESADAFEVYSAESPPGVCPFGTIPVYRVYNNRPDANHRYTISLAIRNAMLQAGWVKEGYGPEAVAFCVPR